MKTILISGLVITLFGSITPTEIEGNIRSDFYAAVEDPYKIENIGHTQDYDDYCERGRHVDSEEHGRHGRHHGNRGHRGRGRGGRAGGGRGGN